MWVKKQNYKIKNETEIKMLTYKKFKISKKIHLKTTL